MKKILGYVALVIVLSSCGIFGESQKSGCPANSKAIGAEKLASGDAKAMKAASKAPKFKY